ncbi:MAG: EAL domain-containing protein [Gammaproteobacteria bacterium]
MSTHEHPSNPPIPGPSPRAPVITMPGTPSAEAVAGARMLRTLQALAEAVIATDAQGNIEYMNPSAEVLTGIGVEDALGRPATSVFRIADLDGNADPEDPIAACMKARRPVIGETAVALLRDGGNTCSIEYACTPADDGCGGVGGVVLSFRDVTDKHAAAMSMSWAAKHDALTGLINRQELEHRLRKLLDHASMTGHSHALCYIDLDHFKRINDGFGHAAGDEYLKGLTAALRAKIRGADTIARLGGDEFAVLLYSCPIQKARAIAEGIAACVADYRLDWQGQQLDSTASMGVVEINRQTTDLTELLASADVACYAAKNEGGNRVHTYHVTDSMLSDRLGEIHWLRCMQHAILKNKFLLYSQPIVPAADTRLPHGSELLLRLQDDNGRVFTPAHFMPSALRYHVLPDIDRWLARKVIRAISRKGNTFRGSDWTSMNVSGQSLLDDRFLDTLLDLIKEYALPAERLCFEIAEMVVVEHPERAQYFATKVKDAGCQIAIDDCGALIGSFSMLRKIPMDYLKISETIVRRMAANPVDREITVALARIANRVGIRTIGECVADVATMLELRRIGVDYVQGHVFAEPRPVKLQPAQTTPVTRVS